MTQRKCLILEQKLKAHLKIKQNPSISNSILNECNYSSFNAKVSRATLTRLRNFPEFYFIHADIGYKTLRDFFLKNKSKNTMVDDIRLMKARDMAGYRRQAASSQQWMYLNPGEAQRYSVVHSQLGRE
ncbi:hypothetical protein GN958_ATG04305 [Phytophthora infestans]|uniref:Uncharacterized protein n=1 Tax=Phytophthora infestans TaxID=4787 RepID=A0A8S9V564_PHYIN|nr:hypothetical protein GN958_ATG04305 [Phytophthora infestans]